MKMRRPSRCEANVTPSSLFSQARKGKYLKPAAVSQDRAVPVHKLVEAAHLAHHIVTGAQMQVVRVGKLDLTAEIF